MDQSRKNGIICDTFRNLLSQQSHCLLSPCPLAFLSIYMQLKNTINKKNKDAVVVLQHSMIQTKICVSQRLHYIYYI